MIARAILAATLALTGPTAAAAQDLDDVLEGFDDDEEETAPGDGSDAPAPPTRWWELTGSLSLGASYALNRDAPPDFPPPSCVPSPSPAPNLCPSPPPSSSGFADYRNLARLRGQLLLQLDLDLWRSWEARMAGRGFRDVFYAIEGRSRFSDEVLDAHEREIEFGELWIRGSLLDDLDLKFGRQILSWGRSDNLRVLDLLNPVDLREPGLIDIEDLKRPVVTTRLDYYLGSWTLTGIAIHESRFNDDPVYGSDFDPLGAPGLPEETPANGGSDTEWAVALRGVFTGWDVSLHWARIFQDEPHVARSGPGAITLVPTQAGGFSFRGPVELRHSRLTLVGGSGQFTRGSWLFKGELAYLRGVELPKPIPVASYQVELVPVDTSRYDAMVGVEYAGFPETTLALEIVNRHLSGFSSELETFFVRRDRLEYSFRYTQDFWNARLHATAVVLLFGSHFQDGGIYRTQLAYDIRDALTLTGGVVAYREGDAVPFNRYAHHDRLFAELKYSF